MGLVKSVSRKQLHQIEQLDRDFRVVAFFKCALLKQHTMLSHLLGFLFTHRPAQQISAAKRVTTKDL